MDMTKYGRSNTGRWQDGRDAVPVGTARVIDAPALNVSVFAPEDRDLVAALELHRMRTKPHLYDDWQVDMALEFAYANARGCGMLLADCHNCRTTSRIEPDRDTCPICRAAYPED